jgi:hypothetical protein
MMGASSHQWTVKRSRSAGRAATSAQPAASRFFRAAPIVSLALLLFATLALAGCGTGDTGPCGLDGCGGAPGTGGAGGAPSTGTVVHVCNDGDVAECHYELPKQGDIINCFSGVTTCVHGSWGPCEGGSVTSMSPRVEPPNDDARLANVPGEMPHSYPDNLSNPAFCNPITSCAHDWCSAGAALNAACDPCVASICAVSPGCCAAGGWTAACVAQVDSVCKLSCFRDPCNPSCQNFNEKPLNGVVLPGMQIAPWDSGSAVSISGNAAWLAKGKKEPCVDANDCQFNTYCNLPQTNGSVHDKCGTGVALADTAGADVCVDKICSLYPNCCTTGASGTCSHNRCTTGAPLVIGCDLCVTTICALHPQCCGLLGGTAWDATCVAEVSSICGQACNSWDAGCVSKVHDTCGAFCNTPPATAPPVGCDHDKCYTGGKLSAGCADPCVAQICAVFPNCCNVSWDQSCTNAVNTVCSKTCPLKGVCEPWLGGQTDPNCPTKPDLTLGIPCNTNIPICNVGGKEAIGTAANPISVTIAPGASGKMPNCAKDAASAKDCPPFIGTIAPGQCVNLDCPAWADKNGAEILVNGDGKITECVSTPGAASCNGINTNNWTISGTASTCEPPICTGSKASNPIRALSMHIMVERSASSGPAGKWTGILTGVANYLQNASAAGAPKAAVQFFPDGPPEAAPPATPLACTTTSCVASPSSQCAVRTLSAASGISGNFTLKNLPWTNAPTTFLTTLKATTVGAGLAPTSFAYDGALNNIVAKAVGGYAGDRNIVLILTSDITTCGGNIASLAGQASIAFQTKRSRTWVIGVGTVPGLFDAIANSGGTGTAFTVASGDDVAITNVLNTIQSTYVPCSFPLPALNLFDPSNPKVEIINADSSQFTLMTKVANLAACSPVAPPAPYQFYYDNNIAPANIVLCPATCTQIRTSAVPSFINKAVKLTLSCPGTFDDSQPYVQTYASNCPNGTKVQWGFLTYDTIEPPGTSTDMKVRVSDDAAAFALLPPAVGAPPYYNLGTATLGPPDTQQCLLVGGPAVCSVDLFNKMGGLPAAGLDNLELTFIRHTNIAHSQTPTINGWQITYSCPDSN